MTIINYYRHNKTMLNYYRLSSHHHKTMLNYYILSLSQYKTMVNCCRLLKPTQHRRMVNYYKLRPNDVRQACGKKYQESGRFGDLCCPRPTVCILSCVWNAPNACSGSQKRVDLSHFERVRAQPLLHKLYFGVQF